MHSSRGPAISNTAIKTSTTYHLNLRLPQVIMEVPVGGQFGQKPIHGLHGSPVELLLDWRWSLLGVDVRMGDNNETGEVVQGMGIP